MSDHEITHDELVELCRRAFSDRRLASVRVDAAYATGAESRVHRAEVVFADGQTASVVLRSCQRGPERARLELRALQHVAQHGFPAPRPVALLPEGPAGVPWLVLHHVEGRLLTDVLRAGDEADRIRWMMRLGQLMAALHALPFEPLAVPAERSRLSKVPHAALVARLDAMRDAFERFGQHELEPVVDWARSRLETLDAMAPVIVHYDIHPHNVVVDAGGELHLLDWSVVSVSDPRFDVAMTCAIVGAHGGAALAPILVAEYERCRGRELRDLGVFEALVGATNLLRFLLAMPAEPLTDDARAAVRRFAHPGRIRRGLRRQLPTLEHFHDLITHNSGIRVLAAEELIRAGTDPSH